MSWIHEVTEKQKKNLFFAACGNSPALGYERRRGMPRAGELGGISQGSAGHGPTVVPLLNSLWFCVPNPPCSQGMGQSSCSSKHQAQHPSSASPPPPRGPGVPRERCGLPRLRSSPCAKLTELSRGGPGAVPSWGIVLAGLPMAPRRTTRDAATRRAVKVGCGPCWEQDVQGHSRSPEKFKPWGLRSNLYVVLPTSPNFVPLWLILILGTLR